MDLGVSVILILIILIGIVIYQSRHDKPPFGIYLQRLMKLQILILNYFKDVGICAGQTFRNIDWDLTQTSSPQKTKTKTNAITVPTTAQITSSFVPAVKQVASTLAQTVIPNAQETLSRVSSNLASISEGFKRRI